jgi:hypothetical protein
MPANLRAEIIEYGILLRVCKIELGDGRHATHTSR